MNVEGSHSTGPASSSASVRASTSSNNARISRRARLAPRKVVRAATAECQVLVRRAVDVEGIGLHGTMA